MFPKFQIIYALRLEIYRWKIFSCRCVTFLNKNKIHSFETPSNKFTARIRRIGECNIFSLFTPGGGYLPWIGGGYPTLLGRGVPILDGVIPTLDGGTYLGWGILPTPWETEQHSEYVLRGRRYASYVHAGGLSCLKLN